MEKQAFKDKEKNYGHCERNSNDFRWTNSHKCSFRDIIVDS